MSSRSFLLFFLLLLGTSVSSSSFALKQCETNADCANEDSGFNYCFPERGCAPDPCYAYGNVCVIGELCFWDREDFSQSTCGCFNKEANTYESCSDEELCCAGSGCKNLSNDPTRCGSCYTSCGPGESCTDGKCTCGSTSGMGVYDYLQQIGFPYTKPSYGNFEPSDAARDVLVACVDGQACCGSPGSCVSSEECACGTITCGEGQECCTDPSTGNPRCVPTGSDDSNCGECGCECGVGSDCSDGSCSCETGMEDCDGDPVTGCESKLAIDENNCGSCGNQCAPGEICQDGRCLLNCQLGYVNCNGKCVNLDTDQQNCGTCGRACGPGYICDGLGYCDLTCQAELTDCGGFCVNLADDRNNCGACGQACGPGEICQNGQCLLNCQLGYYNCGGNCVNLDTDSQHCGTCGRACESGETCDGHGVCEVSCQQGLTECGGICRDMSIDPRHCGTCGNECQAGEVCLDGGCASIGISAFDAAPSLFIPYWSTGEEEETILAISSVVEAAVQVNFYDGQGVFMLVEEYDLLADELLTVRLSDLGLRGDGSIVVNSKEVNGSTPNITAETVVRGGKKDEVYSFSPANALKGVWTTFAPAWHGSYGSLEYDELFVFGPGGELATELENLGILPGRPANGYPNDVVIKIFDELGEEIAHAKIPLHSVTRIGLYQIAGVSYGGPGTLQVLPALDVPDGGEPIRRRPDPTDYVFISYLKQRLDNEIKTGKEAVKSGYLFSETPQTTR